VEPQSRFGHCGDDNNPLPLSEIEPPASSSSLSLSLGVRACLCVYDCVTSSSRKYFVFMFHVSSMPWYLLVFLCNARAR
jgi:hypothetical protein